MFLSLLTSWRMASGGRVLTTTLPTPFGTMCNTLLSWKTWEQIPEEKQETNWTNFGRQNFLKIEVSTAFAPLHTRSCHLSSSTHVHPETPDFMFVAPRGDKANVRTHAHAHTKIRDWRVERENAPAVSCSIYLVLIIFCHPLC